MEISEIAAPIVIFFQILTGVGGLTLLLFSSALEKGTDFHTGEMYFNFCRVFGAVLCLGIPVMIGAVFFYEASSALEFFLTLLNIVIMPFVGVLLILKAGEWRFIVMKKHNKDRNGN